MVTNQSPIDPPIAIPVQAPNWIDGVPLETERSIPKLNPATGAEICRVSASGAAEVDAAVAAAFAAQATWQAVPGVQRGLMLHNVVLKMKEHRERIARIVHLETGKSMKDALGETDGAIQLGLFYAGEGQRLYGRTTTSGTPHRQVSIVRQPIGIAGLIAAANTPIANVAWKVFPALICGNTAVFKAAEDTPLTAWIFFELAHEAGLPSGVLNLVQGLGVEAGQALVEHQDIGVISFTGSSSVGTRIAECCARRLARVSLELGGKNPLVVCDDADLELACKWALLSAFSNAGQRCAAASRIIVFDKVYDGFRDMLLDQTRALKVGTGDEHDLGPVINERQLQNMLKSIRGAESAGAKVLIGGHRLEREGFYMAPTLIEGASATDELSCTELFGPIASLYRVNDFAEALELSNESPYGLTSSIHTTNINRAMTYAAKVHAGVCMVNAGTYGSEPHMPFGGRKRSGNGSREPGTEALDVYSELKTVFLNINPDAV